MASTGEAVARGASRDLTYPLNSERNLIADENYALAA